jgi:RHS repeat-associated protein
VQVQGQILAQYDLGAWTYILPDHLGSVRQLTNAGEQVTLAQSFDPFGVSFESAGSGASAFGYTGEQMNAGTGLVFLRARYYDPAVGRFLTRDTWQGIPLQPLSLNPYLYSLANPIDFFDPSGYAPGNACSPPFDGYMEGLSLSYGGLLSYFAEFLSGQRRLEEIYFKYSVAVEWVYDFEHDQMALFHTVAQTFEPVLSPNNFIDLGVSLDTTHYQGTIDGFGNYPDVTGYEGAMMVRGANVGMSLYLYGGEYTKSEAYPTDTYIDKLSDVWTVEINRDLMTVNYTGFSASLGGAINSLRGFTAPTLDPSVGLSVGASLSSAVEGPIRLENSEQMARVIEQGLNSFSLVPDFLGRRVTYLNPLLIPKRMRAVKVLRTYF